MQKKYTRNLNIKLNLCGQCSRDVTFVASLRFTHTAIALNTSKVHFEQNTRSLVH